RPLVQDHPQIEVSLLAHLGIIELTLSIRRQLPSAAETLSHIIDSVKNEIGEYIFSEQKQTLAQRVGELLLQRNETVALAESCTGGMLGAQLTRTPGSSAYFSGGVVSYSNASKINLLGVQPQTLQQHGAVSCPCAEEMAQGALNHFHSTWALSITGIAGPDGGSAEKPVGTVWICLAHQNGQKYPFKRILPGDRESIRQRTCVYALDQLRRVIQGLNPHE